MASANLARERLWRAGRLAELLLDERQQAFVRAAHAGGRRFVLCSARRSGKSHACVVLALETGFQNAGCTVIVVTKTFEQIEDIIVPLFEKLTADCPEDIKPRYFPTYGEVRFKNGSVIKLAGVDSKAFNRLRGMEAHLVVVDEAGFIDPIPLDKAIGDVLSPTLLTTGGSLVIASTPPDSSGHPFKTYFEAAEADGASFRWTTPENTRLDETAKARAVRDCGGADTPRYKREHLAMFVSDTSRAVVPEWAAHPKVEGRALAAQSAADRYLAIDLGFRDPTGILWGTWLPATQELYISREFLERGVRIEEMAAEIRAGEAASWPPGSIVTRVSDHDPLVLDELHAKYGILLDNVDKVDKEAQISALRAAVAAGQIVISPDCPLLARTLEAAVWNETREDYERDPELGHADLLDALRYMWRTVRATVQVEERAPLDPIRQHIADWRAEKDGDVGGSGVPFLRAFSEPQPTRSAYQGIIRG